MTSKRAFTLAEVIVAAFIITMGFFALGRILPEGKRGGVVDKNRLIALRLARNTLDTVRSHRFLDPNYVGPTSTLVGPVGVVGESVEGRVLSNEFAIKSVTSQPAVAPAPAAGGTPLSFANVTVTVEWHEGVARTNAAGNNSLTIVGGVTREP